MSEESVPDRLHDPLDCPCIVVCRNSNKNVDFADTDQLAKKIIRKNAVLGQTIPPSSLLQIIRNRNQ